MSKKIVFVGPPGVGKTTLRKVFFEGESSQHLLNYALEPTHGQESIILNLMDTVGVFDLAGQENQRWLMTEERGVFKNAQIIIIVNDAKSPVDEIIDFTKKILKIRDEINANSLIYLLVHKVDLLDKRDLLLKQTKIYNLLINDENIKIKFTSITKEYFANALSLFINILKKVLMEEKILEDFNFSLLKNTIQLLLQFKEKDLLTRKFVKETLNLSEEKLSDVIDLLCKKKHLELTQINNEDLLILTNEGKVHFNSIIEKFDQKSLNILEKDYLEEEKITNKKVPPFLGFFLADKDGKNIMTVELYEGVLEHFLTEKKSEDSLFDIELIPMFISALEKFSQEINIEELAGFKLKGRNLNLHIFSFDYFTFTVFTNPNINIKPIKEEIQNFLETLITDNQEAFNQVLNTGQLDIVSHLIDKSQIWIEHINQEYKDMLLNLDLFDFTHTKELYDKLDDLLIKVDKKFTAIKDNIKSLKIGLMNALIEDKVDTIKDISFRIQEINTKFAY